MTRPRRRVRSHAEQMYWDQLTPSERLAFTIGFAVGQGADFPTPAQIAALRGHLGATVEPPVGSSVARSADGSRFTYDFAQVARIAREAVDQGRSATVAVFQQIDQCASLKAASVAISRARKLGYDIPLMKPAVAESNRRRTGAA